MDPTLCDEDDWNDDEEEENKEEEEEEGDDKRNGGTRSGDVDKQISKKVEDLCLPSYEEEGYEEATGGVRNDSSHCDFDKHTVHKLKDIYLPSSVQKYLHQTTLTNIPASKKRETPVSLNRGTPPFNERETPTCHKREAPSSKTRETPVSRIPTFKNRDIAESLNREVPASNRRQTPVSKIRGTLAGRNRETPPSKDKDTPPSRERETPTCHKREVPSSRTRGTTVSEIRGTPAGRNRETPPSKDKDTPPSRERETPTCHKREVPSSRTRGTTVSEIRGTPAGRYRETPPSKDKDTPTSQTRKTALSKSSETPASQNSKGTTEVSSQSLNEKSASDMNPCTVSHKSTYFESGPVQQHSSSFDHSAHGTGESTGNDQSSELLLGESPYAPGSPDEEELGPGNHISTLQNQDLALNVRESSTYDRLPLVQIPLEGAVGRRCQSSALQPGVQPSSYQTSEENNSSSGGTSVYNLQECTGVHITNQVLDTYDPLKPLNEQSKLRLERDVNTRVFVKTEKIKECEKTLKTWGVLLLTGGPGEGKTTAGLHLLKLMSDSDSRRPLILTDPQQWDHLSGSTNKKNRYVILIDDAFGRTNLVEDLRTRWEQKFPMMLPLIEAGNVCVIFAFRTNIFLQNKEHFRTVELFKSCKPVNLSSDDISEKERLEMLDIYLKPYSKKINVSDDEKRKIVQSRGIVSFPLCCCLFTSNRRGKYDFSFFQGFLTYLSDLISSSRSEDPEAFLVLLLVMFYENLLPKRVFDVFEQRNEDQEILAKLAQVCSVKPALGSLLNSAKSLCQTFLIFDTETQCYSFMHNSIQDAVFIEFCKEHLSKELEICSIRTLLEYVRTDQSSCQDAIEVVVSQNEFDKLASRLIKEILSPNISQVVTHPAFKDLRFIRHLDLFLCSDKRTEISAHNREIHSCGVHQYLTDTTITFLMNKCLNQPTNVTTQNTFDPKYTKMLSIDSIPACFVLNGADRLAIHFLKHMKQNEEVFSRHANQTLVCSFYMNNIDLVDELIELGAEITFDCFKAVCIAAGIDENLVEIAVGVLSEEHIDSLWELLALNLEHGHFECIKQIILFMVKKGRFWQLEEFCKLVLIVCHNTTPSWISVSPEQTMLVKVLELLHSQGVNSSTNDCVLLAAGCHDLRIMKQIVTCGGNIQGGNKTGQNPLHLAALYGSKDLVLYLIQQKVEKHARDNEGYTPFHRAAQSLTQSYDKIVLLADENAELQLKSGESVLDVVIRKGDFESVEYICRHFAVRKKELGQALYVAVTELAKALSNHDRETENVFHVTWTRNRCHIVNCLITAKFPLNFVEDNVISSLNVVAESNNGDLCEAIIGSCDLKTMFQLLVVANQSGHKPVFNTVLRKIKELMNTWPCFEKVDFNFYFLTESKVDPLKLETNAEFDSSGDEDETHLNQNSENKSQKTNKALVGSVVNIPDLKKETTFPYCPIQNRHYKALFHHACEFGDTATVKCLLQTEADVNIKDSYNQTPLHYACERGDTGLVVCLVQSGANVNVKNIIGRTSLHYACAHGDTHMVEYLVQRGAEVNVGDWFCKTPLHYACEHGDNNMVEYLVKGGAEVNVKESGWETPLHFACAHGDTHMVEYLVQKGAEVNVKGISGRTSLHDACERGDTNMVEYLVKGGAEVNVKESYWKTPLHFACAHGDTQMVEYLVKGGAEVNVKDSDGKPSLHYACARGDTHMVEYLVQKGAEVNVKDMEGKTSLHYVCERGDTNMVEYLVQKGAEVNVKDREGKTSLHYACERGDTNMVEYLVKGGAEVNVKESYWKTPLHFACAHGDTHMVEYLVKGGAEVNVKESYWKTPLHFACAHGDTHMVEYLVKGGAEVNVKERYWKTPLHYACAHGDTHMVEYLVQKGAEVNVKDMEGKNSLHYACAHGDTDMVEYLVQRGAKENAEDCFGKTPVQYARECGSTAVVECLLQGQKPKRS